MLPGDVHPPTLLVGAGAERVGAVVVAHSHVEDECECRIEGECLALGDATVVEVDRVVLGGNVRLQDAAHLVEPAERQLGLVQLLLQGLDGASQLLRLALETAVKKLNALLIHRCYLLFSSGN